MSLSTRLPRKLSRRSSTARRWVSDTRMKKKSKSSLCLQILCKALTIKWWSWTREARGRSKNSLSSLWVYAAIKFWMSHRQTLSSIFHFILYWRQRSILTQLIFAHRSWIRAVNARYFLQLALYQSWSKDLSQLRSCLPARSKKLMVKLLKAHEINIFVLRAAWELGTISQVSYHRRGFLIKVFW